jgi:hypothetical protein
MPTLITSSICLTGGTRQMAFARAEHELRKYELALVHGGFGREFAKNRKSDFRRSNRDQTEMPNSTSKSFTYDVLMCKRWDTTEMTSITNAKSSKPNVLRTFEL